MKQQYRSFEDARKFVHKLGLNNTQDWRKYCKGGLPEKGIKPYDIPTNPQRIYKANGWAGLGDWLGTGTVATFKREYCSFNQARSFVHNLELKNVIPNQYS